MGLENHNLAIEDILSVRSDKLKDLRNIISGWESFSAYFEGLAQFKVVVDSNIVIGDILWLVSGRKNKTAKTDFMEIMAAQTVEVYAPPKLFIEVDEKIPLIAAEKGLDASLLFAEWSIYKLQLKASEPDVNKVQALKNSVDPDDAEFVALAQTINAAGIFSKDQHIAAMGGNQISVECITHLRNYSRHTVIDVNIKVNGILLASIGVAAVIGLFNTMKALMKSVQKAPDWLKIALIVAGIFALLHPKTRNNINSGLNKLLVGINEATPSIISKIGEVVNLAQNEGKEAQHHLNLAIKELNTNGVTQTTLSSIINIG